MNLDIEIGHKLLTDTEYLERIRRVSSVMMVLCPLLQYRVNEYLQAMEYPDLRALQMVMKSREISSVWN